MATKVKGLFRGLRYVSQIFDERKEKEMQIGLPTDVKHVSHIGWDGPSVDSPSWMKSFESVGVSHQSKPLKIGDPSEKSPARDPSELPKPTRRHYLTDDVGTSSPRKEKSRRPRRHHLKDSINSKLSPNESGGPDSPARDLSDIPKKSRRKKSKDSTSSSRSSKPRDRRSRSGSGSGSGLLSDPESSITPLRNKEDKESSDAC